ncbi:MAG TPA: SDR family oxidoreductase [Longimicrobium sp.]|uniref:SDR family oxidoreductase n=1 Tax=Longimicrobium sp. TaxID=2029185 RepID=UPI002ED91167
MILVLGSTGTTGGEVARQLIAAGHRPRLLVRDPARAAEFQGSAEIVRGDLDDADSLRAAMAGIERVYMVSAGGDLPAQEGRVVDAAREAGVRHVVKLSVMGADDPQIEFSRWHAKSERHLMDSGLAWTMVRPGNFMTNSLAWADTIRTQGAFYQPTGEGRWAAIDPADIAAVAVRALTEDGHEGQAYAITGPESLSAAEYAQRLSAAIGKPVNFVDVPPEAARGAMLESGMPAGYVDALLDLLAAMKAGHMDGVANGVEQVTGRPARTFDDWARRNAAAFQ